MKYISYTHSSFQGSRSGWLWKERVVDMALAAEWAVANGIIVQAIPGLPDDMLSFLDRGEKAWQYAKEIAQAMDEELDQAEERREATEQIPWIYPLSEVNLCAPVPTPRSLRDFYAFEQHVIAGRQRRGLEMIPEWYELPVFYFSNHLAICGPEDPVLLPPGTKEMDYELEAAFIIGKEGRDIPREKAAEHIFGLMVMNDWSARDIQRKEMKVGLGPSKGKDFATSLGPYLVTMDELEAFARDDSRYALEMRAVINGVAVSRGNLTDIYHTFADMVAYASRGVKLYPGEVFGSGTVGTGCILELGPQVQPWLRAGDEVELEITGLGRLRNRLVDARDANES